MSPTPHLISEFLEAACVPLDGDHRAGTLEAANALLSAHPDLPQHDLHAAAVLADETAVRRFLAEDPRRANAKGGPREWDALTHLCFSRYLRLDASRSERFVRTARALLDAGADPNTGWIETHHASRPVRESALYGAAGIAHHAALTQLLLERGADPNDEETPYHAPETHDNRALEALVASRKLTADSLATMLLRKADWHDPDGVLHLLMHGADPNRQTRWGYTALHQALRRDNDLAIIAAMLDHGGDLARLTRDDQTGFTIAARRGRGDVLAECERRGIAPQHRGADLLIAACARDDAASVRDIAAREPAFVRELLHHGGSLLAEFSGVGNVDGVRHLLDLGVPVTARYLGDSYYGIAPHSLALHVAAWRLRPAIVKLLLARGSPVDARDAHGRTPLALAVRACVDSYWSERRTPETVALLLRAGASTEGVPFPSGYAAVDDLLRRAGDIAP